MRSWCRSILRRHSRPFSTGCDQWPEFVVPRTYVLRVDDDTIADFQRRLAALDRHVDNPTRIDRIALLEVLKAQICAVQAMDTADLDRDTRADHAALGVPKDKQGRGVGAQVALARRESPTAGQAHLSLARKLR